MSHVPLKDDAESYFIVHLQEFLANSYVSFIIVLLKNSHLVFILFEI